MLIFQSCWCLLVSPARRMLGLVWGCGLSGSWQTRLRPPRRQDSDSRRAHKQTLSCGFSSHTLRTVNVKHAHRRTQILLISLQKKKKKRVAQIRRQQRRRLCLQDGLGVHPCRPLHCLFALETQTLWKSRSEALSKHWGYLQRWF